MTTINKVTLLAALSALFISAPVLANEAYVCKSGNQERRVAISYANEGSVVPCEVTYTKESGDTESLWQAQNIAGYCEEKAEAFIEKLRGWGWECNKQ